MGLPCQHLLHLIKLNKDSYLDYIHKRWIITEEMKDNTYKQKLGRPRFSRRNIH
jgi:hypothetical protein